MLKRVFATLCVLGAASTAQADLSARFIESAHKDRFVLTNEGPCPLGPVDVVFDIGQSPAGLIFDTTAEGAGVEVFQPFEIVAGGDLVRALPQIEDGDSAISLRLGGLQPGETVGFTIDVDDVQTNSDLGQIRVAGSGIEGAVLRVQADNVILEGAFGSDAQVRIPRQDCLS